MLKISTPTRSLLLLGFISCLLLFTFVSRYDLLDGQPATAHIAARQLHLGGDQATPTSPAPSSSGPASAAQSSAQQSSASASSIDQSSSQQPTPSAPPSSADASSSATPSSTQNSDSASITPPPSQTSNSADNQASPTPPPPSTYQTVSTGADGEVQTVFVTTTPSAASSSASASASAGADQNNDTKSKGVGTSTIVGLSVAGGIALICLIAFVVWKFTRKRFTDDFDDNEAIKWPELNTHGENPHALPVNRTGGAGFETNSEVNLTRPDSRAGSIAPSAAASAVDLYVPGQDPYAVPPLPHLNPNQPYRDDPNAAFYDPYNGPVPQTLDSATPGGEAIPMTQINRARSPGPQMAYDPMAAARARSPGPQAPFDLAGRQSPGPQAAYGYGDGVPRARSPGPAMALGGRVSPGPQAALGYGA
ncbi:hypothetical protein K474DRAFT_1667195 [Panus rudis PR-1116 ss-1]|nr:hypothetical protein K474DRAFT_1667195 [Panus rudis PR-1116 ss-1]